MKLQLKSIALSVLIACPIVSFAMVSAPKYCPGVESIKADKFVSADMDGYMGWIAVASPSKYDTQDEWTMAMIVGGNNEDRSQHEAIQFANDKLPLIQVSDGLPKAQSGGYWCFYYDQLEQPNVMAYSFTPAYRNLGQILRKVTV